MSAQTGTTVTGTTKTSDQLTPSAAGLVKYGTQVAGVDVFGKIEFRACATDSTGQRCVSYPQVTCGGPGFLGTSIAYIKGDGTWIDDAGATGAKRVPNAGCTPTGLATEAKISLQPGCRPGSTGCTAVIQRPAVTTTEVKVIPDQASVDWYSIALAAAATPAASYQTQSRGDVLDSEGFTCVDPATVPAPASGVVEYFCDSTNSNLLKRKNSDNSVTLVEGGGGGSGDITDVGNCATGACFQSQAINQVLASPASGGAGVAAFRALVEADIPALAQSKITNLTTDLAGKQPLDTDLTAIAGLSTTLGDLIYGNATPAWTRLAGNTTTTKKFLTQTGTGAVSAAPAWGDVDFSNLTGSLAIGQVPNDLITYAKIQNVSATSRFLGRITAGAGDIEELTPANAATLLAEQLASTQLSDFATKTGTGLEILGCTTASLAADDVFMWDGTKCVNGALSSEFSDSLFRVVDNVDATKKLAFELAGFPTATTRTVTPFNGASVIPEPRTCAGTDKVSAISAAGVVTCSADETGAGGGDAITVNAAAATDVDLDDADPAAPANAVNVKWQLNTTPSPDSVSAHLLLSDIGAATFGGGSAFNWTFNAGATDPVFEFTSGNLKFSGATTYTFEGGATDPVWTPGNSVMNLSTGTLQQGGTAVLLDAAANGILARTAAQAVTARTITGTASRIVVTSGDGVSGNPTLDIGSDVVTPSSTHTLTNKTLDGEGTGNSITLTSKVWLEAAGCQNATASLMWDTPTTSPAVAACVTGTNTQKGVADFADGSNLSMQRTLLLPSDFTGNIDAKFKWLTSATTGDVVWQLATICVADAETDDPAFNTASTVTDTAKGTANQTNDASITSVTITGCAAGELLHLKLFRDSAHASDTLAATARLIGLELTLRRAQ